MRTVAESALPGPVPRYEIPGWRERYGVHAGITGRGSPRDPGFDLGLWTDEPIGQVMERWRAFRGAEPGFPSTVLGNQVHGARVTWYEGREGWVQLDGVDGLATATPGVRLTVTVADCVPVYLVLPEQRVAGLLHAGWRGIAAGILRHGVELLVERASASVQDIVMHCGVAICGSCYEVGSEVMERCGLPASGPGPHHLDLRTHLATQGRGLGLRHISTSQFCSAHDRRAFYSHRASSGHDGRMVAYLGFPVPEIA